MTTATIIVCTCNRVDDLEVTCRGLLDLSASDPQIDLLVVDNGSSDRTPALLTDLSAKSSNRFRWIREPRSGLSLARNAGIAASRGEVLIFIDDDALPSQGWLAALLSSLDEPSVWAAGGPVDPSISSDVPDWFSARFLPYLSAWDRGPEAESSVYNEYPRGTNMAFKKHVFAELGDFLPQLGRR
ncbi:MAG: glycosyltransferase family A protein, partial [Acidobacteriota bacterium]